MFSINPKSILVVRLGALGDLVQTMPAVRMLHQKWPEAEIHWLVEEKSLPLLQNQSWIHPVLFHKKLVFSKNPLKALKAQYDLKLQLKSLHLDLAIDYQGLFKSAYAMSLSQSPVRLGFSSAQTRECAHLLYTHRLNRVKDKTMHRTDLYCLLSQYAGASLPSPEHDAYGFEFSPLEMQSTRILLHRLRVKPEGYLLFSLGTSRETKRYRDHSWIELVKNCRRIYPKVPILLAGHGERDEALARQIYRAIAPGDAVLSAIGKTSVREMAMLVRQCMAIVSPDSMALHLASAFQKPAIGIFGGKSLTPVMGSPRANDLSQALASEIPCFPCRRNACDHHSCMKDITVGEILRGLQPMIPKKYRKGT